MTNLIQPFGLGRSDAAAYLGLSVSAFDRLVAAGNLPPGRMLGAAKRWARSELERALVESPADSPPSATRRASADDQAATSNPWDASIAQAGR